MKPIQPVTIWINGQDQQANNLDMAIIYDNLSSSATFYYQLIKKAIINGNEETTKLADGNLSMDGQTYASWDGSNDAAYTWGAAQLNLTLL